ncbi:MAG: DUF6144 family protein [Eubacteriales bacterium]|nr:DUF6144 family protein [Eubacteriales bacterium]
MFSMRKIQEQVIYDAVKEAGGEKAASEIVFGKEESARSESDPAWVQSTMCRLEEAFDGETVKRIRMRCQCGYGMDEKLALLQELMQTATSMETLAGSEKARAAGLSCKDGQLYLQFAFCPCPMLAEVRRLESMTWCACSAGYSKVLFEKAFGCEVDVTMLKSIKCGDDICLMKILPKENIWK